jgi:DNA-binding PadR family transcriptional regulator
VSESTQNAVLGLLARRPTHGYALFEQLRHLPLDGSLVPSQRTVYRAIEALRAKQLIEPLSPEADPEGRLSRRYQATAEGERRLESWMGRQPETFGDLCLRICAARPEDLESLLAIVIAAEHECLARLQDLQAPEIESLVARKASWDSILVAMLKTIGVEEFGARLRVLRKLRRGLEAARDDLLGDAVST